MVRTEGALSQFFADVDVFEGDLSHGAQWYDDEWMGRSVFLGGDTSIDTLLAEIVAGT